MPTDEEKRVFYEGVQENMENFAAEAGVPLIDLVTFFSMELQPNGLPAYYCIQTSDRKKYVRY